jgi:secondary thiamine-phosphate synthase enzyme
MRTQHTHFHVETPSGIHLTDLTPDIRAFLARSGIRNGVMTITSRHTTTAIVINENESRLMADVGRFLTRIAPPGDRYEHNDIHLRDCPPDEPENAHSHLLTMFLGSSEAIPILDGQLDLGQWQSVMLVELDGPRTRKVSVQILGE